MSEKKKKKGRRRENISRVSYTWHDLEEEAGLGGIVRVGKKGKKKDKKMERLNSVTFFFRRRPRTHLSLLFSLSMI